MEKSVKGCMNKECIIYKKKTKIGTEDNDCAECGQKLTYICRKCYADLGDRTDVVFCQDCIDEKARKKQEKKEKLKKA